MFGRTLVRTIPLTLVIDSHDRWGQIAIRTAKLEKGGSNLSGRAVAVVAVLSVMFAILAITLGVLGLSNLMSAIMAGAIIGLIIVYLVGAAKLSNAIGNGKFGRIDSLARVVMLTRQVAGALVFITFVAGGWTVLGDGPMPVQMVLANLLLPMCAVIPSLLLLRFIRRSFDRQEARLESRAASKKLAGTKPTARFSNNLKHLAGWTGVALSTDFAKSSTNGKSATDV